MLATWGMIEKRIAVLGTDEAYEVTKNRMAQADQERKEVRWVLTLQLVVPCTIGQLCVFYFHNSNTKVVSQKYFNVF